MAEHPIAVAATVVAAVVAIPSALLAIVQLTSDDDPANSPSPVSVENESEPEPVDSFAPRESVDDRATVERANINLAYSHPSCGIDVSVTIGDRSATPAGQLYTMQGIESGIQGYSVDGLVECLDGSFCFVSGEGSIDVVSNQTYGLFWSAAADGCVIELR